VDLAELYALNRQGNQWLVLQIGPSPVRAVRTVHSNATSGRSPDVVSPWFRQRSLRPEVRARARASSKISFSQLQMEERILKRAKDEFAPRSWATDAAGWGVAALALIALIGWGNRPNSRQSESAPLSPDR
jgi:hypothetical protein